jgi:hypothetical protein
MMKKLILAFGVLGLVSLFIPQQGMMLFSLFKMLGMGYLVPIVGGFAAAVAMGAMAMSKPPMQKWQAGVAAGGFALIFVRFKLWEVLKEMGALFKAIPMLLFVVAVIGGLIVSIMALAKGEESA